LREPTTTSACCLQSSASRGCGMASRT
jgi:hypothetical protein